MGVIDIWHQPFTKELLKKAYIDDPEQNAVVKWWGLEDRIQGWTPAEFVAKMDRLGIKKVCIPAGKIKSFVRQVMQWDFQPEEIYDIIKDYPDRLYGLYGINPHMGMDGVRELEKSVKEYGFVGAHLHTYGFNLPINDKAYYPFYAKCEELGIPVVMQVGHSAESMPSAMGRPILIDDIALYFKNLKIVGAHTGWPWVEELIAMAWKHKNVYIATTAHAPKYWDKSLVQFLNSRRGMGKVMYGTDFPVLTWEMTLAQIDELGLKDEAKAELLSGCAKKVFNF